MTQLNRMLNELNSWNVSAFFIVAIISIPALNILFGAFARPTENWQHIQQYLLTDYIVNTIVLFAFTGLFASLIGVSLAYITTVFDFPLKNFFRWALILPLSIPAYIGAYTYSGMVDYTGSVTKALSYLFGKKILIDIMSIPGAIFIFSIFLFPYVYIISRSYFTNYTASLIESARMLGKNYWQTFYSVVLPISRGVIASGCSLVLMEVANDYGVVNYFGINTFSIAIFKVWFGMNDIGAAIRLCLYLMGFVLFIITLEKLMRGQRRFGITTTKTRSLTPHRLAGWRSWLATAYCFLIFGFGFLFPLIQLIVWATITYRDVLNPDFLNAAGNTIMAATFCAAIIVICSIIITNSARISHSSFVKLVSKLTTLGYSIPGAVIAIGVLVLFVSITKFTESLWGYSAITSLAMLYFAYLVRFLAVGCSSIENGFEKVGKTFFEASRTLGYSTTKTFFKVDAKMTSPSIIGAFALVFVDMTKELPLTLILRPFQL